MAKRDRYWKTYTPDYSATYYKKQLQKFRGSMKRGGGVKGMAANVVYSDYIKEKYGLMNIREKDFLRMTKETYERGDISFAERKRLNAAYYERELKVATGAYDKERINEYLDRVEKHLTATSALDAVTLELFDAFIDHSTYRYVSKTLPSGDLIFADSGDKQGMGRGVDIEDQVKEAIVKAANIRGYNVKDFDELVKEYYNEDIGTEENENA